MTLLAKIRPKEPLGKLMHYTLAVVAVAVAMWLRMTAVSWFGHGFPPYITFYPAMMVVVVLTGFGPSVLATALMALVADCWILPPVGKFAIISNVDRIGLAIFTSTNLFMCLFAEFYRRTRNKAIAYERETALRQTEERLALAASATQIGMFDWNVASDSILWTQAHEIIFGYTSATITTTTATATTAKHEYRKWANRVHPEDLLIVEQEAQRCMQEREPFEIQYRIIWPDGSLHWVETKGIFLYDNDSNADRMLGIVMDITERKLAEEKLQESELRFRTMANAIPQLSWIARADGFIFWYNQRWYDYTGTTPEQMEGWGWQSIHDPNELPRVLKCWQSSIAAGEPFEMTFPLRGSDGLFRSFLTRVIPLKDDAGRVQQWFGTNTDISELKRVERELRASEALYRAIGESIDYGVWVCAPDGRNTYASESFLKMVGITQEQCSNFGWGNVLHPDDAERTIAAWQECIRAEGKWDMEHRFRGSDGQWHHVLARGVPVRNEQGEVTSWAGINLDINQLKQAEEQVKASLAEKEVLLREIHHRVKNNLQVIASLVSLQAEGLDDDRMREELSDVCDRVHSIALVHEKLYQTGELAQLNFANYATSFLESLWESHDVLVEKIQLKIAITPISLPIETAVPCGLILNELAGNALKHAFPKGSGGEVMVGLKYNPANGTACLRVRDNGIGLPVGLDWRHSSSLGLRLVQILAGQLRGTVETGAGPGAEFQVNFPLKGMQP